MIIFSRTSFIAAAVLMAAAISLPTAQAAAKPKARIRVAAPVSIAMPSIRLNARVESRGLTYRKIMQVPTSPRLVAWFNGSPKPGQPGEAVIYGHLTDHSFRPAIFSKLNKLKVGDQITVTDANHNVHTYKVYRIRVYPANNLTFGQIARVNRFSRLNLYTCAGKWDPRAGRYTHFHVVFTTLISSVRG